METDQVDRLLAAIQERITDATNEEKRLTIVRGFRLRAEEIGRGEGLKEALALIKEHLGK
ncbi:MAG: hypothetical protein ABJP82_20375 [Hyphomicrobiales bacterium]